MNKLCSIYEPKRIEYGYYESQRPYIEHHLRKEFDEADNGKNLELKLCQKQKFMNSWKNNQNHSHPLENLSNNTEHTRFSVDHDSYRHYDIGFKNDSSTAIRAYERRKVINPGRFSKEHMHYSDRILSDTFERKKYSSIFLRKISSKDMRQMKKLFAKII